MTTADPTRAFIEGIMAKADADRLAKSENITLGELIARLEAIEPAGPVGIALADAGAMFFPTGNLYSYRGYYSDLAIEWRFDEPTGITAGQLLDALRGAVGKTYQGYKGGDYEMGRRTPVWVAASWGDCSDVFVSGVEHGDGIVILTTGREEW